MLREVVAALRDEARATNERRLLVLAGSREACYAAVEAALDAAGVDTDATTLLGERDVLACERLPPERTDDLLGTTHTAVVVDCHDGCSPNALGRAVGGVDGGGLLLLLAPPLSAWPDRRDGFDEGLAVPPFDVGDVSGNFRRRLVDTLRVHPGIAIVDADSGTVERDGLTDPAPRRPPEPPRPPDEHAFPREAYDACLTADQVEAVRALEALRAPGNAVVLEADRGRGKSSAAGLAAGALAGAGRDVLVTAPGYRNAREVFARAGELLADLDALDAVDEDGRVVQARPPNGTNGRGTDSRGTDGRGTDGRGTDGRGTDGGRVRFVPPTAAADLPDAPDAVVVDEAAALPVDLLGRFLEAPAVAFSTTVHGYEGAGRGFSVRFRDRLAASDFAVTDVSLAAPIRYAASDPVEVWAFRALLLDARPAVDQLVEGTTPDAAEYVRLDPGDLAQVGGGARDGERRLREAFGLLVLAHYRTEPNDLARLLDAPNVAIRALLYRDRIVSVALLAREGGLSADRRRDIYEGGRVKGNMLPDVLTSQLRDEDAGAPVGVRIMRIATHPAVRSRGLGSTLLGEIREEFAGEVEGRDQPGWNERVDWLGVGYGATPDLLRFWAHNGYATVHLSTSRNETSGEYSALMLDPLTEAGRDLHDRSARWFVRRIASVLSDPLDDADPDVVRATLRATDPRAEVDLDAREWRLVAAAAFGPGLFDVAPRPFRGLALKHLVERDADLDAHAERLLVRKVLQARPWPEVTRELDYESRRVCMRALGDAFEPLVDAYGTDAAQEEADRYR